MGSLLQVTGLCKNFGALTATDNVNLTLETGAALGIIGPNGAGKSTLFNLIAGTFPATSGKVYLDGKDVSSLSAAARCRMGIGRTYQIPKPFTHLTVLENLLVAACFGGQKSERVARVECLEILENLGLGALVNKPAGQLRLLERKRLEMARALATNPRLLLLDEIAGGLTEPECDSLIAAIRNIQAQGVTIIWIEHVVHALLAVVDQLAVINFGAKIIQGDPTETFESRLVQDIYLGIEA
ncbi:MAG: ABC transporter ATP-binding protein [Rhodobacteraceae bacterium]|nr:MAG: ABC transporter ATP-binding protein [Paracoccaceae bacterium]